VRIRPARVGRHGQREILDQLSPLGLPDQREADAAATLGLSTLLLCDGRDHGDGLLPIGTLGDGRKHPLEHPMNDLADLSPVCLDQRFRLLDRIDAENRQDVVGERAARVFLEGRGRLWSVKQPGRRDGAARRARVEHAVPGEDGRGGARQPAAEQPASAPGAADLLQVAARRPSRPVPRVALV
jgi:hypothetical protein